MPPILFKELITKIRSSIGRYLSLAAIVALGVAFFAGIKASAPIMKHSADSYFDKYNVQDIQLYSTIGLDEQDLEAISKVSGVEDVIGVYSADYLSMIDQNEIVVKVISFEEDQPIDDPRLVEGRMPSSPDECLIEANGVRSSLFGSYDIGQQIELLSPTDDPVTDTLKTDTFTIVGKAYNPNYLSYEKGTSNYGSGEVDTFIYIEQQAVEAEYYTEADIVVEGAKELDTYSDAYFDVVDPVVDRLESLADSQLSGKTSEYRDQLEEKQAEMDKQIAAAQKELDDAKDVLNDSKRQLEDGQKEIETNEKQLNDAKEQLAQGWDQYWEGKEQLESGLAQITSGLAQINAALASKDQLEQSEKLLSQAIQAVNVLDLVIGQLQALIATTPPSSSNALLEITNSLNALSQQITNLENTLTNTQFPALQNQMAQLVLQIAKVQAAIASYLVSLPSQTSLLQSALAWLQAQRALLISQIGGSVSQAQSQLLQLQQALAMMDGLQDQKTSLIAKQAVLEMSQQQLTDSYNTLISSQEQITSGQAALDEAKAQLAQGQAEYDDGLKQYNEGLQELESQKAEGEKQIEEARAQIKELGGQWIILDREMHYSYRDYEATAERMDGIASVFPVFFYLVAALVCMTTMTRMIDEERTDIGTLKALGYSRYQIASLYLLYAGSASLVGSLIGDIIGITLFPWVIFTAWNVMYNLEGIVYTLPWDLVFLSDVSVILIILLATIYSIYRELQEVPAQLMRPKANQKGKTIFLERIPWLWSRLSFMRKVTMRNIFRYKKRFFMTVLGIAGCSALLVSGFGINDSISDIVHEQYEVIYHYDATVSVDTDTSLTDEIESIPGIESVYEEETLPVEINYDNKDVSATLHILQNVDAFEQFMTFVPVKGSPADMKLGDDGVFIAIKTAEKMGKSVGDTIEFKTTDDQTITTTVAGIFDQYIDHQIYVSKKLYDTWHVTQEPTISYLLALNSDNESAIGRDLMELDGVKGVTFFSGIQETYLNMINSIKLIVVVLVISAGALAFVVLYNLSNVNISERAREIATIKVLGFTDREVSQYVNRESFLLALIGAIAGLGIGVWLHNLIMNLAELENVRFGRTIFWQSFAISIVLTMLFTVAINGLMRFKLKKIEMVESLKAIE